MICPSRSSGASDRATVSCAFPPRDDDDDLGIIDRSTQIRGGMLHRGQASGFHIDAATLANGDEPRVVEIVQTQSMPGHSQFGDEIDAADTSTDDRHGAHAMTPAVRSSPSVSRS